MLSRPMSTLYDELRQVQANLRRESDRTLEEAVRFVKVFRRYFATYLGCSEDQIAINLPYRAPYDSTLFEGVHSVVPIGLDFMRYTNRIHLGLQVTVDGHLRYQLQHSRTPALIRLRDGEPDPGDLDDLCCELVTFLRQRLERTRIDIDTNTDPTAPGNS